MNTYVVQSKSNYDDIVVIINADSEQELEEIIENDDSGHIWPDYFINQLDTTSKGVVYDSAEE